MFFKKDKDPDSRLLRLDDEFTSAARHQDQKPRETLSSYRMTLSRLVAVTGLSAEDEAYKGRLVDILKSRIEQLEQTTT